jgi:nitrite reductase/ring-hydroxylating ferredoxin subunit
VGGRTVICPLHERRFDLLTGADLAGGPCVRSHPVAVSDGKVYVALSRHTEAEAA